MPSVFPDWKENSVTYYSSDFCEMHRFLRARFLIDLIIAKQAKYSGFIERLSTESDGLDLF